MRYKHTLQSAAFSLSLGLGLSFFSLPARAQTGTPIVVNGGNYTPTSGTTIDTVADGTDGYAVRVYNSGTLNGAEGWNLSTSGSSAYGVYAFGFSTFSGTNLNISTSGVSNAVLVNGTSSVSLTGGTLTTANASAAGVYLAYNSTATLTDVTVNLAGPLVSTASVGVNTVTLNNVHGTNGSTLFSAAGSSTTNLTIQNSTLSGNLVHISSALLSNVNLVSGTITGASIRTGGTLNVSVDSASKWIVSASSSLTSLGNQGVVDMRNKMTLTNFTQEAGATLAMTLLGTGGVANQLVNINGQLTLAGALVLNGNAGAAVLDAVNGGYFVLFNKTGSAAVSGEFSSLQLNGVSYSAADGSTFTDANGYTYTLSYQGDAATGALTGGNDVLLHVVPEPGAWALLAGGLGLLFCGQRLRRRSRG